MKNRLSILLGLGAALVALSAPAAEIVILKGGRALHLSKAYVIRGSQAVMSLEDGTLISVPKGDIDLPATWAARRQASGPVTSGAAPAVMTPVEAARAQRNAPKAKVKIGDADVAHDYAGNGSPAASQKGEGSLEVANWEQSFKDGTVTIQGTLRNAGKAVANGISMNVIGKDAGGKTVGSTTAAISSPALDPGATASFTAAIPAKERLAAVTFQPQWRSPVVTTPAAPAEAQRTAPAAGGSSSAPAYTPSPDYAPPMGSAPLGAPGGNTQVPESAMGVPGENSGYIPGTFPPPPAPSTSTQPASPSTPHK